MKPQNGYLILVWADEPVEKETQSGLILPSNIEDKDTTGWGDIDTVCENSKYEKGQRVIFSKYIPVQFKIEEKLYIAIKESDVIAVL